MACLKAEFHAARSAMFGGGGPIDAALPIGHLEIAIGIMSIGELCIAGEKLGVVEHYVL